jgi:hypothetical protein
MDKVREKFWEKYKLDQINEEEWEQLCDGCGKCCLIKIKEENKLYMTNIACQQIDLENCQCSNYRERTQVVENCTQLTLKNIESNLSWLPSTCSYKLIYEQRPLPVWHHLISKDKKKVHQNGLSIKRTCLHESEVKNENLHQYIIAEIGN